MLSASKILFIWPQNAAFFQLLFVVDSHLFMFHPFSLIPLIAGVSKVITAKHTAEHKLCYSA